MEWPPDLSDRKLAYQKLDSHWHVATACLLAACDCSIHDGKDKQIFEEWSNQDLVRDCSSESRRKMRTHALPP